MAAEKAVVGVVYGENEQVVRLVHSTAHRPPHPFATSIERSVPVCLDVASDDFPFATWPNVVQPDFRPVASIPCCVHSVSFT